MGAGASASVASEKVQAASQKDLAALFADLPEEQRARLQAALKASCESAPVNAEAQDLLFKKAKDGDDEGVRKALAAGAQIDRLSTCIIDGEKAGLTAAMYATRAGMHDMLKLLKESGANLNAADEDGWTAAHYAVRCQRKKCIEMLCELGADFNALTKYKRNPVDILEEDQADLDDEGPEAAEASGATKVMGEIAAFFKAKKQTRSAQGSLLLAARNNDAEGVVAAVAAGADVNLKTVDSNTALHLAAEKGSHNAIKALVEAGASLDGEDKDKWTSVHFAAAAGESECLVQLAALGANLSAITMFKRNALDLVSEDLTDNPANDDADPRKNCVRFLREKGLRTTPHSDLFRSAKVGNVDALNDAAERGAEIDLTNASSFTAFMCAADMGNIDCLRALKERGANIEMCDRDGWTAIHFAVYNGQVEVVKLLAELGADTKAVTKYKRNCLDLAEDRLTQPNLDQEEDESYSEIVRWLRAARLKPSPQGQLLKHTKKGAIDGVKEALEAGAEVNFKDFEGFTAADWAHRNGFQDCLQFLKDHGAIFEG